MHKELKKKFGEHLTFGKTTISNMLKELNITRKKCQSFTYDMNTERIKKLRI
jgi:hypothetical protein